ncbi:MAG: TolC family protein [Acidobacteria bacterium]|nr:TolC family protein [Acidobacteriota bacterium]
MSRRYFLPAFVFWNSLLLVHAQQPSLRLDELLSEALRNNPEIMAAQKRYEAARQRPTQESSLPDPMVSLGYASSGSPRPFAGLGREPSANAGVMFSQEVPFPGKRKLRGDMALKEADAEFQQYQAVQLNVISRLKQAYYRLHYAYAASDVLRRNRQLLANLLRITEARYTVGRAAQQDVYQAQTQLSILDTRLLQLEREGGAREAEINSLLNRAPKSPLGPPAELQVQEFQSPLEDLYAYARENSPMLKRDQKMIERTELAVNLARREYYPDYSISGGYFNQGSMPDMYEFRVDFKLPLYFWRKQRAGVTEQSQNLVQTRRNYEATNQSLYFRIKDDYLMADTSSRLVKIYGQTVVPQATLALESSLASYETGAVDFLSVLNNFITVFEYELNYYEELQNFYLALSRLEEMTAFPIIQ